MRKERRIALWREREPGAFFDDAAEADFYEDAIQILSEHGYEHYEVSNFAKPGHRCVHNANYWENGEYRGFGVGAASYRDGERWVQTRSLDDISERGRKRHAGSGRARALDGRGAHAARPSCSRCERRKASRSIEFRERYGVDFLQFYAPIVDDMRAGRIARTSTSATRG